ncbi:unnamed protein product [Acanthoscelides obtectus]|uniref:Uncharacterized protein n=1 Tax=Acanthoscelides obtectus TaxID=200917 RepID=A0A9P0M8B0_ACAOB|nr:unnamed protein product [Acanthoscelides obtectus]CAK1672524.1 hypothetical protein AOBTE_LOCUS28942 [Acanthoscelides obtectus]
MGKEVVLKSKNSLKNMREGLFIYILLYCLLVFFFAAKIRT